MSTEGQLEGRTIGSEVISREEVPMVRRERWEELRRLAVDGGVGIAELARQFGLDRKTVRRCVREPAWRPYQRPARAGTLLAAHVAHLRERAPQVGYSAQILFQELRQHGYTGSYETVKLFVRPLRAAQRSGELTLRRFETPPGQQSQIDWGTATLPFRQQRHVRHVFVLTLGFSRRSYYHMCPNERLPQFLDAHERAFEYFGGHTREHLYDRPRTVCLGTTGGRIVWNATFKAFAEYWSFEPRLCQPYRAQTKGYVAYCTSLVDCGADLSLTFPRGEPLPLIARRRIDARGLEQVLRLVVVGVGTQEARPAPDLGGCQADPECPRDLGHREQPSVTETLVARCEAVVLAHAADHHRVDRFTGAGAEAAIGQERCDLLLGVIVQEAVDLSDDLGAGLAQGPGGDGPYYAGDDDGRIGSLHCPRN